MGVIGLLLIGMRILEYDISINNVAVVFAIGRLTVTLSTGIYWSYLFQFKVKAKFAGKRLLKTALPLFLVSATTVVAANTSVIVLGWLGNAKQVGLFTVASQIALLTVFFLQVTNSTIAPKLAVLYAAKKVDQMQTMVQEVTGILLIIATVSFLTFIFAGKLILSVWGSGFTNVYYVLIIISFGQFVNIATGAGGLLLIMSGFEKVQSRISLFFVVLNVVLNFILIYYFGILGAAIATATTMTGENITRVIYAKRFVGVLTLPVNILFK
jgi:O-antigen/teichoic acid export membrane protein